MRLIKAKVSGYRRLARDCEVKLDTDPVCIVGPNAAGKSSFLDSLLHLNHDDGFENSERTRKPDGEAQYPIVEARFVLAQEELSLLADIPEASAVRQLLVRKEYGEPRTFIPQPTPKRDLSQRQGVLATLEELKNSNWLEGVAAVESELDPTPENWAEDLLDDAIDSASLEQENLNDRVSAFQSLRERLVTIVREQQAEAKADDGDEKESADANGRQAWPALPKKYAKLEADLHALIQYEELDHPRHRAARELEDCVPGFVKFNDLARELASEYVLTDEPDPKGAAIHNFLDLGETSWVKAEKVVQSGDKGRKKAYLERVNGALERRAAVVWEQSKITVGIDLDGSTLTVLLSMQEDDYIDFEEHSDGLRQFIALRAFIASEADAVKPIVLIDEAETHLHYDAQADIVGVFEEQEVAAKIIYTTHSAGCLPRDLGLGIRAIVPDSVCRNGRKGQGDHSHVINKFWTEGRGYSPLLLAMGAGALAFAATQKAVVTEGMSDALLLPSLIREATGESRLNYQAAPSFAEADPEQIRDLDLIASRIAFLADGDEGGEDHVKQLTENGIMDEQIRFLGGKRSGLAIEDLLDKTVYLNAVNRELDTWHKLEYPASKLPESGRSAAVKKWCEKQEQSLDRKIKLSKVDVAQGVLDQRCEDVALLDEKHRQLLVDLHSELEEIFDEAPERLERLRDEADQPETRLN
ncbi:MAG TPA: AAA family ATPase [Solirubrobacterales bacterium]|nr:AAA family ATPase [Solirubrobacterales bacterium]